MYQQRISWNWPLLLRNTKHKWVAWTLVANWKDRLKTDRGLTRRSRWANAWTWRFSNASLAISLASSTTTIPTFGVLLNRLRQPRSAPRRQCQSPCTDQAIPSKSLHIYLPESASSTRFPLWRWWENAVTIEGGVHQERYFCFEPNSSFLP